MMKTTKDNPRFLNEADLVKGVCVRLKTLESIIETVKENTTKSNQHVLVIGPRGSGKSSLLLRVAAETRKDPVLADSWYPIIFSEESYEISTCGEFWLECLFHLGEQIASQQGDTSYYVKQKT